MKHKHLSQEERYYIEISLKKAHQELDKAVDKCYTNKAFKNDKDRIEFLFGLYEKYIEES